jgi:hypothetical protein
MTFTSHQRGKWAIESLEDVMDVVKGRLYILKGEWIIDDYIK